MRYIRVCSLLVITIIVGCSEPRNATGNSNPVATTVAGGNRESSFKKLAAEKETRLRQLVDCRNLRSSVQGDSGTIQFGSFLRSINIEVGWQAKYGYRNGKWEYISSERQVWDELLRPVGWDPGDTSGNDTDIEIVRILK